MDPAEPDFEHLSEGIRLDPADANFVDVIHTNGAPISSLGYGLMQASGHVDFYVNGGEKQPGCKNQLSGFFGSLLTFNTTGTKNLCPDTWQSSYIFFQYSELMIQMIECFFCSSAIGEAVACSHGRAHVYFTESILTDCPFTAFPCDSYVSQ